MEEQFQRGKILKIHTTDKRLIVLIYKEFLSIHKKREPLKRKKWPRMFTFLMDNKHIKECFNILQFFQSKPKQ